MARKTKPVDLRAAAAELEAEQDALAEAQKLHGLRRANDRLSAQLKQRDAELAEALGRLAVLEGIDQLNPEPHAGCSRPGPGPRTRWSWRCCPTVIGMRSSANRM